MSAFLWLAITPLSLAFAIEPWTRKSDIGKFFSPIGPLGLLSLTILKSGIAKVKLKWINAMKYFISYTLLFDTK